MGCTGSSVADVLLEAEVVLGAAAGDLMSLPRQAIDLTPRLPSHLVACRTLRAGVDEVIGAAFDDACNRLASATGLELTVVDHATSSAAGKSWFVMATAELAQSLADTRDQWSRFEPTLRQMVEIGAGVSTFDYIAAARRRWEECLRVDTLLGDAGVLLTPTVNAVAWAPEGPLPSRAGGVDDSWVAVNTSDFNFTGHPALNVPLGRDDAGVPFGLQIVAPRCCEGLAFGLAEVWERLEPWPAVADGYRSFDVD